MRKNDFNFLPAPYGDVLYLVWKGRLPLGSSPAHARRVYALLLVVPHDLLVFSLFAQSVNVTALLLLPCSS